MSKPIYMTPAMREEVLREFAEQLDSINLLGGKIKYETSYYWPKEKDENGKEIPDQITVRFSKQAQIKQEALIREFTTEVGWHGVAHRDPEDQKVFHIDDIIVFPQEVTGSNVTPDQAAYSRWLMQLPDDQFNFCRYHGHSHVNMGVSPSGTDDRWQADTLKRMRGEGMSAEEQRTFVEAMGENAFYIFMIWNKRGEVNVKVYDLMTNHFYEDKEVQIRFEDVPDLREFLADAKSKVKMHTYSYQSGGTQRANTYPGYGGYGATGAGTKPSAAPSAPPAIPPKTTSVVHPDDDDDAFPEHLLYAIQESFR